MQSPRGGGGILGVVHNTSTERGGGGGRFLGVCTMNKLLHTGVWQLVRCDQFKPSSQLTTHLSSHRHFKNLGQPL